MKINLTNRQHSTILLIMMGMSTKEIAKELHVSVNSAKDYCRMIYKKAGVDGGARELLAQILRETLQRHDCTLDDAIAYMQWQRVPWKKRTI
ncbi:MAG: helix-turn-helix transcriptional regulator, partial [Terriglobia bacterium]